MSDIKTKPTDQDVVTFLNGVTDEKKRMDCFTIMDIMKEVTQTEPVMWGDAIVGFGSYHYKYASGREGDMPLTGFSPRKQNLTMYIMHGFDQDESLMQKLGKYTTGKSCLYVKHLSDIDIPTLKELIRLSVQRLTSGAM